MRSALASRPSASSSRTHDRGDVAGALTPPPADADASLLGRRAVLEALRAGRPVSRVLVARSADVRGPLREIVREARARRVVVQIVDRRRLDALAHGIVHQGVAAMIARSEEHTSELQ